MVAKKVRDCLPLILCTQWQANSNNDKISDGKNGNAPERTNLEETTSFSMDDECYESLEVDDNEKVPEMYLPLKEAFLKAFKLMDKELKLHPTIDCFCSGTTAVTLVKQVILCAISLKALLSTFPVIHLLLEMVISQQNGKFYKLSISLDDWITQNITEALICEALTKI